MKTFLLACILLAGTLTLAQTAGLSAPPVYAVATGSVNVLAVTQPGALLKAGQIVLLLPNLANTTTTPTLNVNGLGAKTITKNGTSALAAGDLITTAIATLAYDGTYWQLQNPQTVSSAGAISSGATPPTACGAASGCFALYDSASAGTPTSGQSYWYVPTSTGLPTVSLNGGSEIALQTVSNTATCIAATTVSSPCLAIQSTRTGNTATSSFSNSIYSSNAPANASYQICANVFVQTAGTGTVNLGAIWTTPGGTVEGGYTFSTTNLSSTGNNWTGCFTTISKVNTSLSYYLNVSGGSGSPVWEGNFAVTRLY